MGINGQMPLVFDFPLTLYKEVLPEASYIRDESVGTIVIVMEKVKKGIWSYLGQK